MNWIFVLTIVTSAMNIARHILYPHAGTLLGHLLAGPIFYSAMMLTSAIALWEAWENASSAKAWAIAASAFNLVVFLRQFVISTQPTVTTWDRYRLSSLIVGVVGIVAFLWPDHPAHAANPAQQISDQN